MTGVWHSLCVFGHVGVATCAYNEDLYGELPRALNKDCNNIPQTEA